MEKNIKDYLLDEEWMPVIGYSEYKISNKGRIKGERRASFGSKSSSGYRRACIWNGEKHVFVMIHRLVAIMFLGFQDGKEINHKDGNKENNRLENLEWVTRSGNSQHAYANNLRTAHPVLGEKHYAAKLTEDQVREIRKSTLSQTKLAKQYNISSSVIQKIKERKSWKHVI
jgi:DNA-binding transcriptional regulator YiaG